jgi:hypothetical protein
MEDTTATDCYDMLTKEATLAQLVERLIRNQQVAGSIPAGGSISNSKHVA